MNEDLLTRFLLPHAGVRGVHVRLHRSWLELLSHADYPPGARRLLGEACAGAALLTAHAKVDGRLSVQLRADAGLKLLFAECTAGGGLRGIVQLEEGADAPADLGRLQHPTLAITIERKKNLKEVLLFDDKKDPYQISSLDYSKNKKLYRKLTRQMSGLLKEAGDPWFREKILSQEIKY